MPDTQDLLHFTHNRDAHPIGGPFERDVEAVRRDVVQGFVSIARATEEYGVAIDAATLEVDPEATVKLRRRKHESRAA